MYYILIPVIGILAGAKKGGSEDPIAWWEMALVLSPIVAVILVLGNAQRIIAWWDGYVARHPEDFDENGKPRGAKKMADNGDYQP
jgi:hypothetical protein